MILTLKTLDHKIFQYEVSQDMTVNDLISRIEDQLGRENIYRLIFSGKILKDDQMLEDYKIKEKQFVVLMITKPEIINVDESYKQKIELRSDKEVFEECENYEETLKGSANETKSEQTEKIEISKDEERELIGLDWIEDQIKEKEKHFITDKDFR